jgi:hypothetical protein
MKISAEQFAKIVEEEAANVLKEVWQPSQTAAKITDKYARLQTDKRPELSLGTDKQKEKLRTQKISGQITDEQLNQKIKDLISRTNPAVVPALKKIFIRYRPQDKLANILKNARIDDRSINIFKKNIEKFITNLDKISTLEEDLKQDLISKRKLLNNLDSVLKRVETSISKQILSIVQKDIQAISKEIRDQATTLGILSKPGMGSFEKDLRFSAVQNIDKYQQFPRILQQRDEAVARVIKIINADILAVSMCLTLFVKQSILNSYSQKQMSFQKSQESQPEQKKNNKFEELKDKIEKAGTGEELLALRPELKARELNEKEIEQLAGIFINKLNELGIGVKQ